MENCSILAPPKSGHAFSCRLKFCGITTFSSQQSDNHNMANGEHSKLPPMLRHSNAAFEQLTALSFQTGHEAYAFSPRLSVSVSKCHSRLRQSTLLKKSDQSKNNKVSNHIALVSVFKLLAYIFTELCSITRSKLGKGF